MARRLTASLRMFPQPLDDHSFRLLRCRHIFILSHRLTARASSGSYGPRRMESFPRNRSRPATTRYWLLTARNRNWNIETKKQCENITLVKLSFDWLQAKKRSYDCT